MAREKIVEGHSTKPVHQERTTYPPGGLGGYWRRRIDGGLYADSQSRSDCYPILLNMQSHSREVTGTVTPFDKYAESQSRSDCFAVIVVKRLLPNLVKYSEAKRLLCCADAA